LHVGSSETWVLNNTHFHGTRVPVEEPSTASKPDYSSRDQAQLLGYRGA
jgi:hypothetical protein